MNVKAIAELSAAVLTAGLGFTATRPTWADRMAPAPFAAASPALDEATDVPTQEQLPTAA